MEWVETTGKTIEEALDAALDQLGVDESDAEFEVLEEPKVGLFGRVRGEARLRARVRPTRPRPKDDRRDRRRRKPEAPREGGEPAGESRAGQDGGEAAVKEVASPRGEGRRSVHTDAREREEEGDGMTDEFEAPGRGVDVPMEEQGEVAVSFLQGLVSSFDVEAEVDSRILDEESFEVSIRGEDLGLLIGPKGATMNALQDLTRTVVQRKTSARRGRLLLDVAGYRERRKEALERFAHAAAERVLATGARVVLEPMNASDRKVVHDTVNAIAGVATVSEGEDPRRRVVLLPETTGEAGR